MAMGTSRCGLRASLDASRSNRNRCRRRKRSSAENDSAQSVGHEGELRTASLDLLLDWLFTPMESEQSPFPRFLLCGFLLHAFEHLACGFLVLHLPVLRQVVVVF